MTPTRPLLRYHGGKWRLAPWIIQYFPDHDTYVEPFCGAASITLRKEPSPTEVLNDRHGRLINCFRVLRDPVSAARLLELLRATPFSMTEYMEARDESADPIEDARRLIILGHQGHGSTAASGGKLTGWRRATRKGAWSGAHEWSAIWESVGAWADRLRCVLLESDDARALVDRWDGARTLFYVDPPYVTGTRTAPGGYAHDMSDDDHRALAADLRRAAGMVVLSGYPSDLYAELYGDWARFDHNAVADHGQMRTECIWLNAAAMATCPARLVPA